MNSDVYSHEELSKLRDRINNEIQRRGSYKWWDPLTTPKVGQDRSSPLSLPDEGIRYPVNDKTYGINNPSTDSLEQTRNARYPAQGDNPTEPMSSAGQVNTDEMKNLLIGLAKIQDINLFYGRDEIDFLAFRDPNGIEEAVKNAERSKLNAPLHESDISPTKMDPNGMVAHHDQRGNVEPVRITYPMIDGKYVIPSGEFDGEEADEKYGIGPENFFDDYGAPKGVGDFHPYNRHTSQLVKRFKDDQGHNRNQLPTPNREGGVPSSTYGVNPRNPNQGKQYQPRDAYGGVKGSCNVACTGLCYTTCDNECSESCSTTCWNRCGNACTASCGNVCTGCSSMCYTSCKTKCENSTGYACVKSGAMAVKMVGAGGKNGEPAKNEIHITTHTCEGCSFSCQFYPNKKTDCWDAGCMGKCFTSCDTACSTSCFGGCVDNKAESGNGYKTGKGRGCSSGCTLNCIGICSGTCEGYCTQSCWKGCKQSCSDNCSWACDTYCGAGCEDTCSVGCTGCTSCAGHCIGKVDSSACRGCNGEASCSSKCQNDCISSCIGLGCKSECGVNTGGSCSANCRMNCEGTSCTAQCSDACSFACTTCVNTCGAQCGACSSMCSTGCEAACNITCTTDCANTCEFNCVTSCSEECGGCSNLCYSCVGMCIGICSVKCESGCSNCTNNCSWWCDVRCSRECSASCVNQCINTCSGSCATYLESDTTMTSGPDRDPTAEGYQYPHPQNRWEERESFKLTESIPSPDVESRHPPKEYMINIYFAEDGTLTVDGPDWLRYLRIQTGLSSGIFDVNQTTGEITVIPEMLPGDVETNVPSIDGNDGLFVVILYQDRYHEFTDDDINAILPYEFIVLPYAHNEDSTIVIIKREEHVIDKRDFRE